MNKYCLSKEEAEKLLYQQVHVVKKNQYLRNITRNLVCLTGDCLGGEGPLSQAVVLLPRHIDRFERKYDKAFTGDPLFRSDIVDRIHKWVQVLLQLCNTACLDDIKSGTLMEFGDLQRVWRGASV